MASFLDVCRFTPTAGGTTDWTYSAAITGYQSPASAGAVNGSLYRYRAESADLSQWEVGYGVYNSSVLTRATVLFNSAGTTAKINFTLTPQVAIVLLAEDLSVIYTQVRLTLTQGTAVTTSDVTGATSVFLEPFNGSKVSVYDGAAYWATLEVLPSTYSLPATQSQSGTTHTSTLLDGLTDTSQMVVGQQVTGTNIAANSTISVINSATSVTLNNATTGSATNTMTFKLPPSTNYDVYLTNSSGIPKMVWSAAWSSDTAPPTRVLQNGVLVASGATTKLLLGSVRTTTTAGLLDDSAVHRWLSNIFNPQPAPIKVTDTTGTWTYSTAAWRQANANTANQADILCAVAAPVEISARHMVSNSTTTVRNMETGIGLNRTSQSDATTSIGNATSTVGGTTPLLADYVGTPGIGRCTFAWLEYGAGADTNTWYGNAGTVDGRFQTGLVGFCWH